MKRDLKFEQAVTEVRHEAKSMGRTQLEDHYVMALLNWDLCLDRCARLEAELSRVQSVKKSNWTKWKKSHVRKATSKTVMRFKKRGRR
jgi:hypothetical protein